MAVHAVRDVATQTPYHTVARNVDHIAPDADAIEELGDEIATLAAHLHAATQRLLMLIAEFDRLRGWESCGHRSCAHWLAFRTGIDLGAAREKVRAARALQTLPLTRAAMRVPLIGTSAALLCSASSNPAASARSASRPSASARRWAA